MTKKGNHKQVIQSASSSPFLGIEHFSHYHLLKNLCSPYNNDRKDYQQASRQYASNSSFFRRHIKYSLIWIFAFRHCSSLLSWPMHNNSLIKKIKK